MILKKFFVALPFLANFIAIPSLIAQQQGAPFQLTEQDVQELQAMEKEINKVVGQMSPEEQARFNKDVEELTKVMETMSEDELIEFMQGVFAGEQPPLPQAQKPAPTPKQPVIEEVKLPKKIEKPAKPSKKESAAVKIIQETVKRINNFLVKVEALPNFPGKVKKWTKDKTIKGLAASKTWDELQNDIESFVQKLSKLDDKDPKTKKYKYIADLLKDEAMYNNLIKLHTTLVNKESTVEVPAFGVGKMNKASKNAMITILNDLIEALYKTKLPESIDALIAKYEPRAKELSKEEVEAKKKALEESKRARVASPAVTAGQETSTYGARGGYAQDPYSAYGYDPYADYDDYDDYNDSGRYGRYDDYQSPRTPTAGSASKTAPTADDKKTEKEKKKEEEAKKKEEEETAQRAKKQPRKKRTNRQLKRFENNLDDAAELLTEKEFVKIRQAFGTGVNQKVNMEFADNIATVVSSLIKARDAVGSIKRDKKLTHKEKEVIKKEMEEILDEYKDELDAVMKQIKDIKENEKTVRSTLSADQLYAYFADAKQLDAQTEQKRKQKQDAEDARAAAATPPETPRTMPADQPSIKSRLATPASILSIRSTYEDIKKSVKNL